jgi:hypothetical protein
MSHIVPRTSQLPTSLVGPCVWRHRYNGQHYDTTQEGYVLNSFRLVGGVRMRQSRMANSSCVERRFLAEKASHNGTVLRRSRCRPALPCVTGALVL